MARYLACLVYHMLMKGQDWVDHGAAYYEQRQQQRELIHLQRKAKLLGFQLVAAQQPSKTRNRANIVQHRR
jgi:transposase